MLRHALSLATALALALAACGRPGARRTAPPPRPVAKQSVPPPVQDACRDIVPEIPPRVLPQVDLSTRYAVSAGVAGGGVAGTGMSVAAAAPVTGPAGRYNPDFHTEAYDSVEENAFLETTREPLSTFGLDVDTASYANVRRFLIQDGILPPKGAVRLEELVNYFDYAYPGPTDEHPIALHTALGACPWAPAHRLLRIGVQGRRFPVEQLPARNLVFLIDVSGSMNEPAKLPLVKQGLGLLVDQLRPIDHVAIVVYAGHSGLALPPTSGAHRGLIRAALGALEAGGSTQGSAGIQLAYEVARQHFQKDAINRVILATDGDFNVGVTSQDELVRLIEEERASGVFLSVLGFGRGNLKDSTMVKLADKGNGHYAYIDTPGEARKVFGEGGAALVTIAKDVKLQVEFNPARVAWYRLLGYEKRRLAARDFHDDTKDAGELGAGHTVTALYELVPPGVPLQAGAVDALKYQQTVPTTQARSGELLTLKCRYKAPDREASQLFQRIVEDRPMAAPDRDFRLAASVATFAMLLTDSAFKGSASFDLAFELARDAVDPDPRGERSEYLSLVRKAQGLQKRRDSD